MYKIVLHDDAKADLLAIYRVDTTAGARIAAVLQEIEGNQELLDSLTQHNYGRDHTALFNVSKWFELWKKQKDIWRIKIWDLEDKGLRYRIVYAYIRGKREYRVLAITPRNEINYDDLKNPLSQRIQRAYEEL